MTTDVDELVILVRDAESKVLFAEAVRAYRAGALRAAVTSTWIAVTYDVMAKLRELSLAGDAAAKAFVAALDHAIETKNIPSLQKIEAAILETAASDFQLLSPREREDLARLQSDRNLCAHPALVEGHTIFQPTPDLVRVHLVHAGMHLLRHPRVQGKAALDAIMRELSRPSFPDDRARAAVVVTGKIARAKESLIRNLVVLLIKTLLTDDGSDLAKRPTAVINALLAVSSSHAAAYETQLKAKLATLPLEDFQVAALLRLAGADPRVWIWLPADVQIRAAEIIRTQSAVELAKAGAFDALAVPALRESLLARFHALEPYERQSVIAENPRAEFAEESVALFARAAGWRTAESLGQGVILPMSRFFDGAQLTAIIKAAKDNDQIWDAAGMPEIMQRLFDETIDRLAQTRAAWEDFVQKMSSNEHEHYKYPGIQERLARRSS